MASSYNRKPWTEIDTCIKKIDTYINFNGQLVPSDTAILPADNRGFRYGDGLFETIKVVDGRLRLGDFHFERLLDGARLLRFEMAAHFERGNLSEQVLDLCRKNGHERLSRVRLTLFRGSGGLYDPKDHFPNYIIESQALPAGSAELDPLGLVVDVFPDGRKSCDRYANLKSNNFLLYVLGALHAQAHGFDDCLVLNSQGRIADSTIANLFYCKQGRIFTPPLSEGCVAGVMRRYLLERLPGAGFSVEERETGLDDLGGADEVFLTNAIRGMRWVQRCRSASYSHALTRAVYDSLMRDLS